MVERLLIGWVRHRLDDLEITAQDKFQSAIVRHRLDDLEIQRFEVIYGPTVRHRLDDLEKSLINRRNV